MLQYGLAAVHAGAVPQIIHVCSWRPGPAGNGRSLAEAQLREEGADASQQASSYSSSCDA